MLKTGFIRPFLLGLIAANFLSVRAFAAPVPDPEKDAPEGGGHQLGDAEAISQASRKDWKPPLKPASDAGEQAIVKFKIPDGLKMTLWAAEPMFGDPNALCTDEKGRIYVAETYRYHGGVIDIREAMNWLEEDLKGKTVADRVATARNHKNEKPGKEALDAPDSERITLLEDTTGSGKADKSTIFADGFNRTEDGLGSGVFAYHGNVYYTCIPSLYLLKDTNGDGKADVRKALQTGYGIRYGFLGHDLHGMVMGPDGKLYFSIGDRGANVTETPDGRHVQELECGAVFRCNLDGTGLEIFARGLRNPQELRFDQYGNLFTGDNNPDKGDPARWVYVIEGGDSGWRVGYQHATRPVNGGSWMYENLWQVQKNTTQTYFVPPLSAAGAGPSGLAYYPGTGFGDRYDDVFFLVDFHGGADGSGIWNVRMKPDGASFMPVGLDGKSFDRGDLAKNAFVYHMAATDLEFGVYGAVYISDWIGGWARPMAGRIYRVFDEKQVKDPAVLEVKKLIGEGFEQRPANELVKLLGHRDMRVRQESQFALAKKGPASVAALTKVARESVADAAKPMVTRLHGIWGLGQIAAQSPEALKGVLPLLADKELEVRCQAAKVLGDGKDAAAYDGLLKLLSDPEPRARFFAASALGKLGNKGAVNPVFNALKENADKDPVLRYGCVTALAALADEQALSAMGKDPSAPVRLGAALALRRLKSPAIAAFLGDAEPKIVLEAARAIHDLPIQPALPALAAMIDKPVGGAPSAGGGPGGMGVGIREFILWRAVNANYRVGTPQAAKALIEFAARNDAPVDIRVEALNDLGLWAKPAGLDRLTTLWRPLPERDAKVAHDAVVPVIAGIAKNAPDKVRVAATRLQNKLGLLDVAALVSVVKDPSQSAEVRRAAFGSLVMTDDSRVGDVVTFAMKDKDVGLRGDGIRAMAKRPGSVKALAAVLDNGPIPDQQAAFDGLAEADKDADPILAAWMDKLLDNKVPPELQLDLLEAAGQRKGRPVAMRLKRFEEARAPETKDPLSAYRECMAGGDAAAGHQIFRERADVSCIRCHTAKGEGGIVGPKLDGIGSKQTREYLLESIVNPNAKIAAGFESVVVKTKQGKFRTGLVKKEDDKELVLFNPDAEEDKQIATIPKADIVSRDHGPSPMPEGLTKTLSKQDLRNLVEFLASLKEGDNAAAPVSSGK